MAKFARMIWPSIIYVVGEGKYNNFQAILDH